MFVPRCLNRVTCSVPVSHASAAGGTARARVNLASQAFADVFDVFTTGATHGRLTRRAFQECFAQFIVEGDQGTSLSLSLHCPPPCPLVAGIGGEASVSGSHRSCLCVVCRAAEGVVNELYSALDITGSNSVHVSTVLAGLSVLCGGSQDEKLQRMLPMFASHHGRLISREQMIKCARVCAARSGAPPPY